MISVRVNPRALAEFACEGGDLRPASRSAEAMREGVSAHLARQAEYGPGEMREETLVGEYALEGGSLRLYGRADGIRRVDGQWAIEEIKWTARGLDEGFDGYPAHWLQACLYALLFCDREGLEKCGVRLVYIDAQGMSTALFRQYGRERLYGMMAEAGEAYIRWQTLVEGAREERMEAARSMPFPFSEYRPGQRKLAQNAYVALRDGKTLVCEAPTGLGKTMAMLYAAQRALGEGRMRRAFFLTARGTGKRAAEEALTRLDGARWVTLYAKKTMCAMEEPLCDPELCPRARGYFDRRRQAVAESLNLRGWGREEIWALAEKHGLCPFELSLDLSETADFIIGDYNYAFDPRARLERYFEQRSDAALLVDEAHNLPDRAREMFSAWLDKKSMKEARRALGKRVGRGSLGYKAYSAFLKAWQAEADAPGPELRPQMPEGLIQAAERLRDRLEAAGEIHSDAYWDVVWFLRSARAFDPETDRAVLGRDRVGVWCMEPAGRLAKTVKRASGAVFFSATLNPLEFYRDRFGVELENSALLALPSPFPPENLKVTCVPLSTRYRDRERTAARTAELIARFAREVPGNILVCFPSYAYMEAVRAAFPAEDGHCWLTQTRDMDDLARREFLDAFEGEGPVGAFVTMGGLFTEGVDLAGDRLVGAVIVGAGLPQVSFETEQLRRWYDERGENGFGFVYAYPGAARVTQAAGRVIRTESDKGRVLLIDDRWLDAEYRALLPSWWTVK